MQCCMPPVALVWWPQSGNMLRLFSGLFTLSYYKINCQLAHKAHDHGYAAGSGRACSVAEERENAGLCKDQWLRKIESAQPKNKCWERPCMFCRWRAWSCRLLRSLAAPNRQSSAKPGNKMLGAAVHVLSLDSSTIFVSEYFAVAILLMTTN